MSRSSKIENEQGGLTGVVLFINIKRRTYRNGEKKKTSTGQI